MAPNLRPAEKSDYPALLSFSNSLNHIHRHLDWRDSLEWLGRRPFWIWEEKQQILATLACPPEPPEVAWIRLFAVSMQASPDRAWQQLFGRALEELRGQTVRPAIVSLALREWYEDLLRRNGFIHHQDIIVFLFDTLPPAPPRLDPAIQVREMRPEDLPEVTRIDQMAFEPIWRLSEADMRFAYAKSSYCSVAERAGQIVGYSMSSSSGMYAHLARLAVHPDLQHQRLGFGLVQDLLRYFMHDLNYWGVTLNTQHNNASSLALYHKLGFRETGERFPVYRYPA